MRRYLESNAMSDSVDVIRGPFTGLEDARRRLTAFVDRTCTAEVGVVWAAKCGLYPLRPPTKRADNLADVVIFAWQDAPKPLPPPPSGYLASIKAFLERAAEVQYQASLAETQGTMALGQTLGSVFNRMAHTHRDDGVGVAIDVLCIALSIALIPTGIGLVTTVAGIAALGGAALLAMDGTAYAMEMSGDDEGAEKVKNKTEVYRIIATVMTLPDLFKGGYVAVKELREVALALPRAEQTAATAGRLANDARNADRAQRYAQIAERAKLRAQIRCEQIIGSLTHEITPRTGGLGSGGLLIREEIQNDKSLYHQTLSRLQIHATSLSR